MTATNDRSFDSVLATTRVCGDVAHERDQQDRRWGQQDCHDFEWVSILTEEVGEAAAEANEANFTSGKNRGDYMRLREELVQVAAVAVAWIECIDRRADSGSSEVSR